jgi:hypothetical protein
VIKKITIVCITILSFIVSLYFYSLDLTFDQKIYGTREIILLSIPFTMVLINSNLFILPKILKLKNFNSRFNNGIDSIFLSLSVILFFLHCGLLLGTTGTEINLVLFIPICVGIVLITTANTLPRFQLEIEESSNALSKTTNQIWNIVIRPFSFPLYFGGIFMIFCVFLPGPLMFIGFFTILVSTLLFSIMRGYRAYQTHINHF